MDVRSKRVEPAAEELPLRPQDEVECRRCRVHCDKVVHPAMCIERACPFVYAYEEFGRTYIGCMQKIFDVEIDLAALSRAQGRRDGFGSVRARRRPLPMCASDVVRCYAHREDELGCLNPEFHELSGARPSFRVIAQIEPGERS
jgi:hypothetical protein